MQGAWVQLSYCAPVKPELEKLAEKYTGRVDLWEINASENPALLNKLKVRGILGLIGYNVTKEVLRCYSSQHHLDALP